MDQEKAKAMIAEVCEWLEKGAPGATAENICETVPADIARDFCSELLAAAGADGQGGCELCRG